MKKQKGKVPAGRKGRGQPGKKQPVKKRLGGGDKGKTINHSSATKLKSDGKPIQGPPLKFGSSVPGSLAAMDQLAQQNEWNEQKCASTATPKPWHTDVVASQSPNPTEGVLTDLELQQPILVMICQVIEGYASQHFSLTFHEILTRTHVCDLSG